MKSVLVLGAGRIGQCIARWLDSHEDYQVTLADISAEALVPLADTTIATRHLKQRGPAALRKLMARHEAVVSACSFSENRAIAEAALATGTSYFDLTEDVSTTRHIRELAAKAERGQVFVPQCGLAPGFIGILGHSLAARFDTLHTLKLRVGALPEFPSNLAMYNLTWSTEGLINEYCNPCEAIKEGLYVSLRPLEGLENFSLDGVDYEAFNTSGGLGSLCETLNDAVQDLTYKTIRYPGHQHLMHFLIHDLRLGDNAERRALLKQIFESSIAVTHQDVVVVFVSATGTVDGKLTQISEYFRVYHDQLLGMPCSAIQLTTAGSLCVVVDMHFRGELGKSGFIRQESIDFEHFIANPFADGYRRGRQYRRSA